MTEEKTTDLKLDTKVPVAPVVAEFDPKADPYANITDVEIVEVLGVKWGFQHMSGKDLKSLERTCRSKKAQKLDDEKFLRMAYEAVVIGRVHPDGHVVPGTVQDFTTLKDRVMNAFSEQIMTFLGYLD